MKFLSVVAMVQYSRRNSVKSPASGIVKLAKLGGCHESEECAKSCAHISGCLCNQSGVDVSIHLLK
jgi:hypothetical protein